MDRKSLSLIFLTIGKKFLVVCKKKKIKESIFEDQKSLHGKAFDPLEKKKYLVLEKILAFQGNLFFFF